MRAFDRIRVLWIDDREEMDGYPEGQITPPEFQRWFEIVHPASGEEALSFRSAKEFAPVIHGFWFADDSAVLPAEIIATDYNLSKRAGVAVIDQTHEEVDRDLDDLEGDDDLRHAEMNISSSSSALRGVNFEGLLISLFYGTLTYKHPAAIVPMTRYLSEMPSEVETLHTLVEPFLGVDFQYIGLEDRRWASILKEGVKHLRRRISDLFESGDVTLSPSDLMALAEDASHGVLTIRSPHALRRLPIHGLFIDVPEEKRDGAINRWASDLMRMVMVDCEELKQAQELTSLVWGAYNNSELVEERKNLSLLASCKKAGKEIDETEYERLSVVFGVSNKKVKSSWVDITSGDYSDRVRRWAALLITRNMLKRLILIKKRIEAIAAHVHKARGLAADIPDGPVLSADDLFLALFPVPGAPLLVPWHEGKSIDKASGWVRSMMRWKYQDYVANNRGDLALSVRDLLAGKDWTPEGPYGLTCSERLVLRSFALEDPDLSETDWSSYNRSKLVLWGNPQETQYEKKRRYPGD